MTSAFAAAPQQVQTPNSQSQVVAVSAEIREEGAVKVAGWILGWVADAIRWGGSFIDDIVRFLDDDAAEAFSRYSDDIANFLDELANWDDMVVDAVKNELYKFLLNQIGLSGGTSLMIADAIAAMIRGLLWLA